MAYKDMILGTLTQTAVKEGDNTYFEMAQEIEEVYRKAKAWDNYIAEVRERVRFTERTEEDIEKHTQDVINCYMEEK
ncbi:hypothetical protein [Staphylococcus equorum]|uniref:hypothetical protein n=1 Tax=Staphylococcus equorum TaxID=246432 RepID=UPI002553C4F8|nr:hypothetical protein [Staphylococcus equorum]MDK9870275.1 hypothetical protein [Staphylococcus equorum]